MQYAHGDGRGARSDRAAWLDAESTAFFAAHGIGAGGAGAGGVGAGGVAVMAASVLAASVGAGGVGAGGGGFGGGDAGGGGAGGGGDHVACAKNSDTDVWVVCSLSESFFLRFDEPILGSICTCAFSRGNRHILDVGRPTFFFSCGLYSSLERSSVPPLSGRFSLVRAREGGLSYRHRHAYTALQSAERRSGRPLILQNSQNRLAET